MNYSNQLFTPDTNVYIFQYQKNQNVFKGIFDPDRLKADQSEKILVYLRNNPTINKQINQKIVSEIKQVCANKTWSKNKKLFFNEDYLRELYPDYPGSGYTEQDLEQINNWWNEITDPDQKFNSADMLIYVICQRSGVTVIITDDIGDFNYCQTIYHQHNIGSRQINIWNLKETIDNLGINN